MANPQIDPYQTRINPQENLPRRITPHMSPSSIEGGLDQVAGALDQKNRAGASVYAMNQLSAFHSRQMQAFEDAKGKASADGSGFRDQGQNDTIGCWA